MDPPLIRQGPQVSSTAAIELVRPITHKEIGDALLGIADSKALGIDGFNSLFFKKSWHIVKHDIYNVVMHFFYTGDLLHAINCTLITLVPKVANPTYVKEFRPIACCTVLYKIIAKILISRMHSMIGEVVDLAQSGFMPGRNISDNILLATELIKGYTTKHVSSRYVVKVDLKKAYNSIEWSFLASVMAELGFPTQFLK